MHLTRASAGFTLVCVLIGLAAATVSVRAQERVSPDKRWEFQEANRLPRIVKAGTAEVVLDLSDALPSEKNGVNTDDRETMPVWAPDSKRVAFNYVAHEHRSSGFGTTVLFELRDDRWVFLRSPLDDAEVTEAPEAGPGDNRDQLARLAKQYLRKGTYKAALLKSPLSGDFLRVVRWSNPETAVFWAFSNDTRLGALAELRVDGKGSWKLMTAKVLSGKAAEKQQEE